MARTVTTTLVLPTDPALPPPPGIIPDFQDPFTLRPYHNVTASLSLVFAGLFLVLRLYTKLRIVKQCRWEDCMQKHSRYTCAIGFAGFAAYVAVETKIVGEKGGIHQWNITYHDLAQQLRFTNYLDIIYSPSCLSIKVSIILLILRIFCPKTRDPLYWVLQTLNVSNILFYAVYTLIPIFACSPRKKIWMPDTPGTCLNIYGLYLASGAFNICSDLAMFFVPLWRIWHLRMPYARRMGVSAIFFTGSLAIASSILRMTLATFLLTNVDYSYVKVQSTIASYAELSFGIICSCLFVLPRLYRHLAAIPPYGSEDLSGGRRKAQIDAFTNRHKPSKGSNQANAFTAATDLDEDADPADVLQRDVEAPAVTKPKKYRAQADRDMKGTWLHLDDRSLVPAGSTGSHNQRHPWGHNMEWASSKPVEDLERASETW